MGERNIRRRVNAEAQEGGEKGKKKTEKRKEEAAFPTCIIPGFFTPPN
jgi:hypothetical protein